MIKDSGSRREFSTGAVRDIDETKGRCDLLPFNEIGYFLATSEMENAKVYGEIFRMIAGYKKEWFNARWLYRAIALFSEINFDGIADMLLELSIHFKEGAEKYGEYNWQKGIPNHCYIDSATRHLLKHIRGDTDERHDRAFVWNLFCCIWNCNNKREMDDFTDRALYEKAERFKEESETADMLLITPTNTRRKTNIFRRFLKKP